MLAISGLVTLQASAADPAVFEDIAEPHEQETARIYRSPTEKREAGLGRAVTDWLTVSGLAEIEYEESDFRFAGSKSDEQDGTTTKSLQLGLNFTLHEQLSAEFVFEYEHNNGYSQMEEGILAWEGEVFSVEAGRLFIPFGEYYSHFVVGPVLEFGETRGNALVADYELTDTIDVFAYGIEGEAKKTGKSGGQIDWGGALEFASEDESVKISAGYFSDMADTDERFLEDSNDRYQRRVGGLNVNMLLGYDRYEITAEYLGALKKFRELDPEEDKPWATNLELAWFPRDTFQLAARIETSSEVSDEPELQYGLSATWLIAGRINLAIDYLYGKYKNDFVFDDDDNEIEARHLVAGQLTVEF